MTQTSRLFLKPALFLGAALLVSACSIAPPMTGEEVQIRDDLEVSAYMPATRDMRDAIETQEMFAQAAFWSREYDLNPGDLESAIKLAASVRKLGNPRRAVEITQTTRALYPRDPYLAAEFVASLIASERAIDAMQPVDEALAIAPQYARLWSLKGAALDQQEQYELARKHYARALQITPNDPSIMANFGLSYALAGDPQTGEGWLRRAVAIPGASSSVHQMLKLVLQVQGKTDEAGRITALTQAPQKYPPRPVAAQSLRRADGSIANAPVPQQSRANYSTMPATRMTTQTGPNGQPYTSASEAARAIATQRMQAGGQTTTRQTVAPRGASAPKAATPQSYDPAEQQAVLDRISGQLRGKSLPPEHAQMQKQANQQAAWAEAQAQKRAAAAQQQQAQQIPPAQMAYPQAAGRAAPQAPQPRGASRRRR